MDINKAIKFLDKQIPNPSLGLPIEVFLFVSRMTPMVNIDLLIKDKKGRTLLSWRNNKYDGVGWHIPGGIVRFKEKLQTRIMKVAKNEIGIAIKFDSVPIAVNQIVCDHNTRGHFISFLYKCSISGKFVPKNKGLKKGDNGYLVWHDHCPSNLLEAHKIYRKFI